MFYAVGLITGLIIGYFVNGFIHYLRKGIKFEIFGYTIRIHKTVEVVEPKSKKYSRMHL